jgi:hypothetical protein
MPDEPVNIERQLRRLAEALEAGLFTWSAAAGEWVLTGRLPPEVMRLM